MRLVLPISFVVLVGSLAACAAKGDEGMFILNNTQVVAMCTGTGSTTQAFTAAGEISYLSAASGAGYVMTPLIESRITAITGNEAQRSIHLESADVTLKVASSTGSNAGTMQNFTALFAGTLAPNGGTANVAFEVMPASSILALSNGKQNVEVIATVTPYGTLGGGRIDGEPFQYPITILALGTGILTGVGTSGTVASGGTSCAIPVEAAPGNICNPYQDGVFSCCVSDIDPSTNKVSSSAIHVVCPARIDASVFPPPP